MTKPSESRILQVLQQFVSPLNAKLILRRACQRAGIAEESLTERELPALATALQSGIRLFVPEESQTKAMTAIANLGNGAAKVGCQRLPIEFERDIKAARAVARRMAEQLGGRSFTVQRAVTAVSELARNIVNYTPGGELELIPIEGHPPKMRLVASDSGTGIRNLDEILAGRYQSRTGLGRGILGVRDLSASFEIRTGEAGTHIELEIRL